MALACIRSTLLFTFSPVIGMLWKWDLARTLGWACPPAALKPSALLYHYEGHTGSWHAAADDLSYVSAWGGLAKYEDWPIPLGCLPCETGMPCMHLARAWNPTGLVMLAAEGVNSPERSVVTQLII